MFDKRLSIFFFSILGVILLSEPLLIFSANILTLFRKDNRLTLQEVVYKKEIDDLKQNINYYNEAHKNLEITGDNSLILAKIAVRNIGNFYDYLIIKTPSTLKKGDEVINENGLIGFVESYSKSLAKVKMITGHKSLSVKVSNSYGLLNSYNPKNHTFLVKNIMNIDEIKAGDTVETSGLSYESKGLYIGKVEKVIKDAPPKIIVKSDVDFTNLNYLYVKSKRWFT